VRYCVAGTTFQIMEVKNPSFYREFMKKYYGKINSDSGFYPSPEGLISLMAEVNPTVNGIATEEYLSSLPVFQGHSLDKGIYVINTSRNYGESSEYSVTASYAHKKGNLFWSVPTDLMEGYEIPSWVPSFRTGDDDNILDMQNQPFSVLVYDGQDQLLETMNGYTAANRDSDGSPVDLGSKKVKNLGKQFLPPGLYKMNISFGNFISQDPNAMEGEYMFGLGTLGQDKSNEYVIITGVVGVENGTITIEINGESHTETIYKGIAVFRSDTWPFDMEGSFNIIVIGSATGTTHQYFRTIVQAATSDHYFQQQYLIIDRDFNGVEDL
jgi:hypothetical protein